MTVPAVKGQHSASLVDLKRAKLLIAAGCAFFTTPQGEPYRSNRQGCNNKPALYGPHGWLCNEHRRMLEGSLEQQRKLSVAHIPNQGYTDEDIVNSILTTEKRMIGAGRVTRIRFGSAAPGYKPDYVKVWEPA